ncbi:MAG TPA: HAMP domain-containing sensor histidine kinase [Solirubrobacterales bacterium]|nr:HAMP domain-containing sensor histidine kinase [Solirubrobacterales bacterium]
MRGRSLSIRLIAASIAAVLLAVLVFGVGARIIVSSQMHSSLDRSLRQRAIEVARLSVSAPAVLTAPGALESPLSGRQLSVEVLDRKQAIVARSLALGAKLLPRGPEVTAALRGSSGFADAELDGEPIRVFAAPIADVSGPAAGGVVLVASSTADIEDTLHQLSLLLLLCGAIAVVAGGLAAAFLTRRSVRPLRQLSSSATTIERTGDASRRLAEPATPEEIGDLARALNGMLAALERSRERERRFLADASHELRTPLTSLIGNVDFLSRHGAGKEVVADLRSDAERLRRLVDDLLVLERESGAVAPEQPVRLEQAVAKASAGNPNVVARIEGSATVIGEPGALARSLENLLENATVHGPPGGRVEISMKIVDGRVEVTVSDEGAGFPPGAEEVAFERFWRAEEAAGRSGSGIGLAIVKATAERHGGEVRASGSTVTITLPIVPAVAEGDSSAEPVWLDTGL